MTCWSKSIARLFGTRARAIWPWSAEEESPLKQLVWEIAAEQESHVKQIVEELHRRGHRIEFGTYPDYSGMHYVSFEYLYSKLVSDQRGLVEELEEAITGFETGSLARSLIEEAARTQRSGLDRLKSISQPIG